MNAGVYLLKDIFKYIKKKIIFRKRNYSKINQKKLVFGEK